MTTKIALVTGASGGLGSATTELLSRSGYFVFAMTRKPIESPPENGEQLIGEIASQGDVTRAVDQIVKSKGRLDVLIHAAGTPLQGSIEGASTDQARAYFEVNFFSMHQVVRSVLPVMRAQGAGKIVLISALFGKLSMPFMGWYSAAKHATEALGDALRLEVRPFGIEVTLIVPSAMRSNFVHKAVASRQAIDEPAAYADMLSAFDRMIAGEYEETLDPGEVSRVILEAVTAVKPRAHYLVGRDSKTLLPLRRVLSDAAIDRMIMGRLK